QHEVDRHHEQHREREAQEVDVGQVVPEYLDLRLRAGPVGVHGQVVRPEVLIQDSFGDDRHRVAGEQRHRGPLASPQGPDEQELDRHPDDEHRRDGDQQADEHVDVQVGPEHVAEVGTEYHHDALGDVDDVEHAEDQRQPDGHQAIDPTFKDTIGDGLKEGSHVSSVLRSFRSLVTPGVCQPARVCLVRRGGTDPVASAGSTCTYLAPVPPAPGCHWKMTADWAAALFSPLLPNCATPRTVWTMWLCSQAMSLDWSVL